MEEFARQDRQHLPAEDNQHNNLLEFASRRPDSWHGHGKLDGELNGQEPKSISVKGKRNASDFFFFASSIRSNRRVQKNVLQPLHLLWHVSSSFKRKFTSCK